MENIILIGSSGHARVIIDIIEKVNLFSIAGFIDSFRKSGEETYNYPVLGSETDIPHLIAKHKITGYIVAVGDNWTRKKMNDKVASLDLGLNLISVIHPSAVIGKNVSIAEGTVIMAGVVINSDSSIGRGCLLNTSSSLDHDCRMEEYSSLAPHATTGGNVSIGAFSSVSLSACISNKLTIGKHTIIGAGSVVLENIPDLKLAFGTPAKVIRERKIGEKYV